DKLDQPLTCLNDGPGYLRSSNLHASTNCHRSALCSRVKVFLEGGGGSAHVGRRLSECVCSFCCVALNAAKRLVHDCQELLGSCAQSAICRLGGAPESGGKILGSLCKFGDGVLHLTPHLIGA